MFLPRRAPNYKLVLHSTYGGNSGSISVTIGHYWSLQGVQVEALPARKPRRTFSTPARDSFVRSYSYEPSQQHRRPPRDMRESRAYENQSQEGRQYIPHIRTNRRRGD
eukprot:9354675-Pyramimonas_sp.AAC.1